MIHDFTYKNKLRKLGTRKANPNIIMGLEVRKSEHFVGTLEKLVTSGIYYAFLIT
jgi:hypothetical protein